MSSQRLLPQRLCPNRPNGDKLGDDLLYGAKAIQQELNLRSIRQVYHLREKGSAPIFEIDGIGLAARKSSLAAWLRQLEGQVANDNGRQ